MTADPDDKIIFLADHRGHHERATKAPAQASSVALLASPDAQNFMRLIPQGFELREDGIHMAVPARDGEINDLLICGPIGVVASARTMEGKNWSKVVLFIDREGNVREELLAEADLLGKSKAVLSRLVDLGFFIATGNAARAGLLDMLMSWNPANKITLTDRLGWVAKKRTTFMLGTGRAIGTGDFRLIRAVSAEHCRASQPLGTLEDWQRNVAALCAGNPLMVTAVSLALAGPLFDALRIESCGLHLRGASASGKSTLQLLACSVWGSGELKHSWNGTQTGFEAIAARSNGTILVLDELGGGNGHQDENLIYMLGNGRGRHRGTATGGAQASANWRLPILSSGEISVEEHMAGAGKTKHAGIEMRLLDIAADTGEYQAFDHLHGHAGGAGFARAVNDAVANMHGTAGPAFVEAILKRGEKAFAHFPEFEAVFKKMARQRFDYADDPQIERTVTKFAVIAFAGEVASALDVTGWQSGTAREAALAVFKIWLDGRQASTRTENDTLLAPLRAYVALRGEADFIDLADPKISEKTVSAGWRDAKFYYFTGSEFTNACLPHDASEVLEVVERGGFLKTNNNSSKGKQFKMPRCVPNRPLAYAVARSLLDKAT